VGLTVGTVGVVLIVADESQWPGIQIGRGEVWSLGRLPVGIAIVIGPVLRGVIVVE
jgi:hypothetical protein